ncbi:unnamed protein product [Closterium sp. NIES-54]
MSELASSVPPPLLSPPTLLLLLLTSLVLRMSELLLLLVGSAVAARARVERVVAMAAGVVVVEAAEAVEVVEVVAAVGVVAGVGASVAVRWGAVVRVATVVELVEVAEATEVVVVGATVAVRGGSGGGQRQQQQRRSETPMPQQLREWFAQRGASRGSVRYLYVIHTGDRAGQTCGKLYTQHRCFSRLDDAWRAEFGNEAERPSWLELLRSGVDIFALDYDAMLLAMYALSICAEGDCYLCVPPDPGIEAAALDASESALPGTAPAKALHTFTLDSGASRCFFRDSTTLTPLPAPVLVRMADPSGAPVLTRSSTVLPCPAVPFGSLSGLHLPSFSTNLVSTAALHDALVTTTSPMGPVAAPCLCRLLLHQTLQWHHCLGHTSLPRLRGMHSRLLFSGLPRSLPPLPPSPGPPCLPCVEGRQRAAPHSSSFIPTTAPLQTLHMDVPSYPAHSDIGGEFSSDLLRDFCRGEGILQSFMLPASPLQNGVADRCIGLVMEVAHTSMIHAVAPHFLWPFAVRYAAHQLNLWPRVSLPETSPTQRWTGNVGDASVFSVWGSGALSAILPGTSSPPALFLDVMFDESVPFYRPFPYRTAPLPPPPLFLAPGPPPVDPLPPQGPAPSDSGAARGAASGGAASGGAEPASAEPRGAESEGAEPGGAEPGGTEPEGVEPRGAEPRGVASAGGAGGSSAGGTGAGGTGATSLGGAGVIAGAGGAGVAGPGGARTGGTRAAGAGGVGGTGAGDPGDGDLGAGGAGAGGTGAGGAGARGTGAGDSGAGGTSDGGSGAGGAGAGDPGAGSTSALELEARALEALELETLELEVLALGVLELAVLVLEALLLCPLPHQSQPLLQPDSPLPAPSPHAEQTYSLTERREPESRLASPARAVRTGRRIPRPRPPPVPGTHIMALRSYSAPLRVPLPTPPASSLADGPDPESDLAHAASPTIPRHLATVVIDPSFESIAASALVAELVDFATACRLDYAASHVADSESDCPPSIGGDPDAPDIPTPRSQAITGPYSSQWQTAMDAKMASLKSTRTYVNAVPPSGANIVDGMWIFRVKRPPGSPSVFKARCVAQGLSQRQGVDFFQTLPYPKDDHSSGAAACCRSVTTHATLRFAPSTADSSLFLRTDTSLPPFYVLVYVDGLVFATADTEALALDRARRTITLTQSHMVHQVLQRFGFRYSSPQSTPLSTGHSLLAPPLDESVEPSGPYPELVGCLMSLMTCTRPDLAHHLSIMAHYVEPGRHRPEHWEAAKRVLHYLCCTSGMRLVLGGRGLVVLTGRADASWVDDLATQWSSQSYTFSLGSGSVSWWAHRTFRLALPVIVFCPLPSARAPHCPALQPASRAALPLGPRALPCSPRAALPLGPRAALTCRELQLAASSRGGQQQPLPHPDTLSPQQLREWVIQRGRAGPGAWDYLRAGGNGQQLQSRRQETLSPQQLREWVIQRGRPGGGGYVPRGTRQQWQQSQLETPSPQQPREWFSKRHVSSTVGAVDLGASDSVAARSASAFAAIGASESAASADALHTFTLDSGASRCFFHDCTTVTISMADPSGEPHRRTSLQCPPVSGSPLWLSLRPPPPLVLDEIGEKRCPSGCLG